MNKSAKEIAEAIISGTRLIDREVIFKCYELADAVTREHATIDRLNEQLVVATERELMLRKEIESLRQKAREACDD